MYQRYAILSHQSIHNRGHGGAEWTESNYMYRREYECGDSD